MFRHSSLNDIMMKSAAWAGILFFVVGMIASTASGARIYQGTYTYSLASEGAGSKMGDVGNVGPIDYTASSAMGNGLAGATSASWSNSNNELGSSEIVLTFDFGSLTTVGDVIVTYDNLNVWWEVWGLRYSTSQDGNTWSDWRVVGTDWCSGAGYKARSFYLGDAIRAIKLATLPSPWYNMAITEVEFQDNVRTMPDKKISKIQINGLAGARHWMWVEAETCDSATSHADVNSDAIISSGSNRTSGYFGGDYPYGLPYSGTPAEYAWITGGAGDTLAYDADTFAIPAAMKDAKVWFAYRSADGQDATLNWNGNNITVPFDAANDYNAPYQMTAPVSLGAIVAGDCAWQLTIPAGSTDSWSVDGMLICDVSCQTTGTIVRYPGFWWYHGAPTFDPNSAYVGGELVTVTITVSDPVVDGTIWVDGAVQQTITAAGIYPVEIYGIGTHSLKVETYSYYSTFGRKTGRVLAGADFNLAVCGYDGIYPDGDFTKDCYVDLHDFARLSGNWLYEFDANSIPAADPRPARLNIAFPVGWYDSIRPAHIPEMADNNFNAAVPYGDRWAYLNNGLEYGVGVIQYIAGSGDYLTAFVNKYKDSPAVLYWNLRDEPIGGNEQSIEEFTANAATVRAADPSRQLTAVFCVNNFLMLPYLQQIDFAMVDRYPVTISSTSPCSNLYLVAMDTKYVAAQSATYGKGAPMFVVQAHAFGETLREPTAFESRYMTFAPVTVGARGIFYYAYFETSTAHKAEVAVNANQLLSVTPAITSREALTGVSIVSNRDSDTALHGVNDITYLMCKRTEEGVPYYYVIAVNNKGAAISNVIFTITGLPLGSYSGEVLYESRNVTLGGTTTLTLTDSFVNYGVHLYKFHKN